MSHNVILITIDCLRADHVGCLGYSRNTTPNIDRLAKKGVLFSTAISNGAYTAVSFPSILTSTYALMYPNFKENNLFLSHERTSIAEVLRQHGYHTAAFHDNPHLAAYFGYDKGFDLFVDHIGSPMKRGFALRLKQKFKMKHSETGAYRILRKTKKLLDMRKRLERYVRKTVPYQTAGMINQEVVSWLSENLQPFFVWIHYMDVHAPYLPPQSLLDHVRAVRLADRMIRNREELSHHEVRKLRTLYDSEIRYIDHELGLFFKKLEEIGISPDNTFFFITSDHGDAFNEHGSIGHGPVNVRPKLYDEIIHVPLIIVGPKLPHERVGKLVSLLDLAPTMMELVGIENVSAFLGSSVTPLTMFKQSPEKGVISEYQFREQRGYSYRTRRWKYIQSYNGVDQKEELYNLEQDPDEKRNLADRMVSEIMQFRKIIGDHIATERSVYLATLTEKTRIREKVRRIR